MSNLWQLVIGILMLLLFAGCANENIKGTVTARLNVAVPFATDYWQQSARAWQCEPPQFELKGGWEHVSGWGWGAYHESWVICGNWNHKAETYEGGLYLEKKWGGIKP